MNYLNIRYRNIRQLMLLTALAASPLSAFAADVQSSEIVVTAKPDNQAESKESRKSRTSDTASLLSNEPGVALQSGGSVSNLPVIHGLADDRLRISVDGMMLIACCPNHMNPPLSYLDPSQVDELRVYAGISPVSVGGDSIGGSIVATTRAPEFASAEQKHLAKGEFGSFYRGNNNARGANLSLNYATEQFSISYRGAIAKADNYTAADDFKSFTSTGNAGHTLPLDEVGSTAYETRTHNLDMAWRNSSNLYEVKLGYQDIPFQLYPNQRMDMLSNEEKRLNLHYEGKKSWGKLDARLYTEIVDHYMDFGVDKQFVYGSAPYVVAPGMPMYTDGKTTGAVIKADLELSRRDLLRIGAEMQFHRLDDWWPPSPADLTGMLFSATYPVPAVAAGMAPNTFWNINDGKRDRYGVFAEWKATWNPEWTTQLGARFEQVRMNTGPVQGYNDVDSSYNGVSPYYTALYNMYYKGYALSATNFNALDRERIDNNLDLTAQASLTPDETHTYEIGFARKTRSPNLYERYSWSRNAMALIMNNYVGDGNGYLGNPDLKPEIAHTISATASWHNEDKSREFRVTPYYTQVTDYIDAVQWDRNNNVATTNAANQFGILKYMNQEARLYGVDVSGRMPIGRNGLGEWSVSGILNYVNGKNLDTDSGLYNVMPLNTKVALQHQYGELENTIELVSVSEKTDISEPRQELITPGYSLVNWRGSFSHGNIRFDFGVENVFDKFYSLPLGGAYTGQGTTMSIAGIPYGITVPGMGRSAYIGMNCKF
ncbi:MAG: TonB-dependent receptor [Chlorobiaceae bacterium]|nr:TonB-dependent receptor [Chlorobiaceae bacterium]